MRKTPLYLTFGLLVAAIISIYSCTKKVNGINNDQVVETPYSLYFSDTAGALYNSTDGKTIKTIFNPDGFPCRAICVDNSNILWAKTNLYASINNGVNFNHAYDSLTQNPFKSCNGLNMDLNQSMMIDIPDWSMAFTTSTYNSFSENYLGVVFSLNVGGILGSWWADLPDTPAVFGGPIAFGSYGPSPYTIHVTSFAELKNGVLCGYDANTNRNFYRTKTTLWSECTANPDSANWPNIGNPFNRSGIPLPHHQVFLSPVVVDSDLTAHYSLGHINNRLIAIDNKNCNANGAYYSDDSGRNWTQYQGLPNKPLLCVSSPFDGISLIGTDSAGLYVLNTNTNVWQQQNTNGLGRNLIVRNIAFKENLFKNGTVQKYVYLATNVGIYQSIDGGNNWTLTIPGNFVAVY